jgi:hypothetical protein
MYRRRRRPLARRLWPAFVFVLLAIPGQGLAAGSSSTGANFAKAEIAHGALVAPHAFTGNLKDLPKPNLAASTPRSAPEHKTDFGAQKQGAQAPAVAAAASSMPAPLASFKGLDVSGGGANAIPPDPVGDAGPNHYVQAVNSAFAVYGKSGTQLAATTFNAFFDGTGTACDANNQGDPTVVYDQLADRWIVADFAFATATSPPYYECIGVSKTSDPVAGGWWQYAVRTDDPSHQWVAADAPKMGIWPDGLYMTANMFDADNVFTEVRVWAFNRSDLESGAALHQVVVDVGSPDYFSLLPSNLRGTAPPAGSPNYLVSESTGAFEFEVWKFHPDYTGNGTTFTGPTNVAQANYTYAPLTVPEPSPGNGLDTVSDRLMMQNQYRNLSGAESIWVNHTVKMGPTGPVGIQWAQLSVTGGSVSATPLQQQIYGDVGSDGVGRWLGSLAVDKKGNMALGYSASSDSVKPDIRYAGRLATDPANTLPQGEASLLGGVSRAVQSGNCDGAPCNRWGAYSSMTVDPDGCTFWYTNEYYEADGLSWKTRIGSFSYPSCSATSLNWAANPSVDFDGDHKTDLGALYRGLSPQDSLWFALSSSGGSPFQIYFGATPDIPVPGDYNGDGKTDAVIFRPSTGLWYGPATGLPQIVIQMIVGQSGDVPVPGDYDGDGKTDPAIYRPSSGMFFAVLSGGGTKSSTFGAAGDVPVPRDYDGDGKTDFGIYRQDATPQHLGLWYAPLSGGGTYQIYFGAPGDIPVPGDYNGDKKAEAVIFREAAGLWYGPYNGAAGTFQLNLGGPGDVPIPGYYDSNLTEDPATYHKSNGNWFALLSGGGVAQANGLGLSTDVPVQKRPALAGGM